MIGLCPVCLFVDTKISSLSSEGLVEGSFQDINLSVRIQKIIVSTYSQTKISTRETEKSCVKVMFLIYTT